MVHSNACKSNKIIFPGSEIIYEHSHEVSLAIWCINMLNLPVIMTKSKILQVSTTFGHDFSVHFCSLENRQGALRWRPPLAFIEQ